MDNMLLSERFLHYHREFSVYCCLQGDTEVLQKYCTSHVVERCKAEHKAFESQGVFFDNKVMFHS